MMALKINKNDMLKDAGILGYSIFSMIINVVPLNLNAWLLTGSLVLSIVLLSGRIYKIYLENKKLKKDINK